MSAEAFSITLPDDLAQLVRAKVASGEYASEVDVVREGLESLLLRDDATTEWLLREAGPAYENYLADPSTGIPMEEVFDGLRPRYEERKAARSDK